MALSQALLISSVPYMRRTPALPILSDLAMYQSLAVLICPFILSAAIAAPTPQGSPDSSGSGYRCFRGLDFPQSTEWRSFQELQDINYAALSNGNSPETVGDILNAIQSVANEGGIDPRVVLAQVMQESQGQLSKAGDGGRSIGLMQVQMANGEQGIQCASDPCNGDEIHSMILQGVLGTTRGDGPIAPGIAFYLHQFDVGTSLRWYNTGSVPNPADLSVATWYSTESYVSDVANRLIGLAPEGTYPDPACQFDQPTVS